MFDGKNLDEDFLLNASSTKVYGHYTKL